jgi:hypothetical protein
MSILQTYKQALSQWGLTANPFQPTPPTDPEHLIKVFHGREPEITLALPALYEGRNIMVRGAWGIGKTALIYTLLHRLGQEVLALEEQMLVLYVDGSAIATPTDFYRLLLLAITLEMSQAEGLETKVQEEAKAIAQGLVGMVSPRRQSILDGRVNLAFFSLGLRQDSATATMLPQAHAEPYPLLMTWLVRAQDHFSRLVFAIDDLDKKDVALVQTLLEGSLDLFRNQDRCAFLMTGRGFTDLQEATLQGLGIFAEDMSLDSLSSQDLRQITINYLNTVRAEPQDNPAPFSEAVMARLADYAQGNPRQLNLIGDKVLRQGAIDPCPQLDLDHFEILWPKVQATVTQTMTPQIRKLLYVAYRAKGISEDITNDQLDQLDAVTFSELIPKLRALEQQGLLLRQEDAQGFRYLTSKLFLPDGAQPADPT